MKLTSRRNRQHGGIWAVLLIVVGVAVVLFIGAVIVNHVLSLANWINKDRRNEVVPPDNLQTNFVQIVELDDKQLNNNPPAPPVESHITVLESSDLLTWGKCPLPASEVLANLNSRTNLTNEMRFYRFVYE